MILFFLTIQSLKNQRGITELVERLPSMYKALGTTHSRLGGDAGTQGVEIGGSKIQIHTHLHSEFKACFAT